MCSQVRRCLLNWSSGKDSAYALHQLRSSHSVEVVGLLTTVNERFDRVAMHAVRRELLERQAKAVGLPLHIVPLPWPCSNEDYERLMGDAVQEAKEAGVQAMVFGDLFLEDIRAYREQQLRRVGLDALFPLWGKDTGTLALEMMEAGLRAIVTCVDPKALQPELVGRDWDEAFLRDLPEGADPCGENGEFHTFVYDGPMFDRAIDILRGEVVERDGFFFRDVRLG